MQCHHRLARLQAVEHLQALTARQELTHMVSIAVPKPCIPKPDAVMVYCHRAIHHLVQSVAVKIGHVQRVVALSGVCAVLLAILARTLIVGVETPAAGQDGGTVLHSVVPRLNDAVAIYAASYHYRR